MAALLCVSFLFAALKANAQDEAEAARQERARKAAQSPKQPPHVYTNDNLKQPQILTPQDRASVEARKKDPALPLENGASPANATAEDSSAPESLGEIARRLRREKAMRQSEQARKGWSPVPFHLELPKDPVLAHPKPLGQPLVVVPPATKSIRPAIGAETVRRDPFSRNGISPAPRSSISAVLPKAVAPSTSSPVVQLSAIRPSPSDSKSHPNTIRVQAGDSLWSLSRRYLGKGSSWHEWLNHNPGFGDPRRMQPGAVLLVPPLEARADYSSDSRKGSRSSEKPPSTISVQSGDSLWKIAAQHLGKGAEWPCLAHANPELRDVARIHPGQILAMPTACSVTRSSSELTTPPRSIIPKP